MAEDRRYHDYFREALAAGGQTGSAAHAYVQSLLAHVEFGLIAEKYPPEVIAAEMAQARAAAASVAPNPPAASPSARAPSESRFGRSPLKLPRLALARLRRRPVFAALAVLVVLAYVVPLVLFFRSGSDEMKAPAANDQDFVVGMKISAVDLARETATFTITPAAGELLQPDGRLARDVTLEIDAGAGPASYTFKAGAPRSPWTLTVTADSGDILNYPFDKYLLEFDLSAKSDGRDIKVEAAFEGTPHGLTAAVTETTAGDDGASLSIVVKRGGGIIFVVILSTVSLLLVSAAACAVAWQVAYRGRKIEFSMMVWVAALLFVIPTVRNGLPGAIPPGAAIDFAIFFWLQIAVVTAMSVLVAAWVRRTG